MKCLVTGGAGFIGSNLAGHLVENGCDVVVLDDFSTGKPENLAGLEGRIRVERGSVLDEAAAAAAVKGCDAVFHQAALPSVPRSHADPQRSSRVNVEGTMNLLKAAADAGVRRFIYASSSSIYGDSPTLPKEETMPPNPRSVYAVSKMAGEYYCRVFSRAFGLETVCLRYFNVFGPKQDPSSHYAAVIPKFIALMRRGESPPVHGDGMQSRDFTYVDNVVRANWLAATVPDIPKETVVNVACGERATLLDLIAILNRILGTNASPAFEETRTGDVKHSLASIDRARGILGYEPAVRFEEGLVRTAAHFSK